MTNLLNLTHTTRAGLGQTDATGPGPAVLDLDRAYDQHLALGGCGPRRRGATAQPASKHGASQTPLGLGPRALASLSYFDGRENGPAVDQDGGRGRRRSRLC